MKYTKIQEEELKNKVAQDFFTPYDCTEIVEKIDFAVRGPGKLVDNYLLWAEAKAATTDMGDMLTQLVLTIGKARTFDRITPPPFLGCFDREKIAFIPYHAVQEIFYQNDFNWKVTPSNRNTREFKQVYELVAKILSHTRDETYLFDFQRDEKELKQFINDNFIIGKTDTTKTRIDKNNFISVYLRWLDTVKPTIAVSWDKAKARGIQIGSFYLADLLSAENKTLKEKLFVLLKEDHYEFDRTIDSDDFFNTKRADFLDGQKAHSQFWAKYERPPLEEYWDYMIDRSDLLVPQDVRERKGSFYTPRIWVELSQQYIADVLGNDWQDEYYVWDCAAGTGNLLTGLTNKYNIWASTIDKADVAIMHDRIQNGANLLEDHCFQFDFLNDDFSKLPEDLQDVINDEHKRKKLVVYINPPYAECGSKPGREQKKGVANNSAIYTEYIERLGRAGRDIFAQFFIRIYTEIPDILLAEFSKLKIIQSPNFMKFRALFQAKLERMFVCPANSFDNVKSKFPIGFMIWNTSKKRKIKHGVSDIYNESGIRIGKKRFHAYDHCQYINDWIISHAQSNGNSIGNLTYNCNDFQHQEFTRIWNSGNKQKSISNFNITNTNLFLVAIFFSVRKVIPATWLNDRDQFLYPNDGWKKDKEFRNDCFTYTLFSNNIQSKHGVNHWIPFTEEEVNARSRFKSNFMTDFIAGKIERTNGDLFSNGHKKRKKLVFSREAKAVFKAGRKLWAYYHAQSKCNVNASLYDIREHFQGRNDKGKMNNKSNDETYNELIADLRSTLKTLARKIEPKVYEYGFLKE